MVCVSSFMPMTQTLSLIHVLWMGRCVGKGREMRQGDQGVDGAKKFS